MRTRKVFFIFIIFVLSVFYLQKIYAVSTIPGSAQPGRVQKNYLPAPIKGAPPQPNVKAQEEKVTPLGKEAEKITFTLNKIILRGNTVYTDTQLMQLYKDKLHKKIT